MFDILFGWRKASKCKKVIRRVQCRLKLLKNKRDSIVRLLREDVAQLIINGHEKTAFNLVEQLFKDESIAAVYELLDNFCEFIIIHLSYIRRHKDCPNDINEAVSSLIFASARCGDLPELRVIRKLFGERYGQRFAMAAVELYPGNLVNRQIKEKLSISSVPDNVKHKLVDEIIRDYFLRPGILALEFSSELQQQQVKDNSRHQIPEKDTQMQASNVQETEEKTLKLDASTTGIRHSDSDIISSTIRLSSAEILESPMPDKIERAENCAKPDPPYELAKCSTTLENKEERTAAASSSESLPQFPEETVIYLDDIEELKSSMTNNGDSQDQRSFKFKSPVLNKREKFEDGIEQSFTDQSGSLNEKSDSRSTRRSVKTSGKRLRRRSLSGENQSAVNDIEYVIYYGDTDKSSPNHSRSHNQYRKHHKKPPLEDSEKSFYAQKRLKQPCHMKSGSNFLYDPRMSCCNCRVECQMDDCSLDHPCYFCTDDRDDDDWEVSQWKQKRGIPGKFCHSCCFHEAESNQEKRCANNIPQKPRSSYGYDASQHIKQSKKTEGRGEGLASPNGSCKRVANSWTRKEMQPPYVRAVTMVPERPKDSRTDSILRSNSCPFQYPNHVHPKLPEYDDIAAKFMALKKEYLLNKL